MATSLQTANYGFGKYAPDDVTSYLTDYNGTMDKIDGAIKGVADVANEAKATGDSNLNNIASMSQGLTATNKNVENLGKTQTAQQTEIDVINGRIDSINIADFSFMLWKPVHSTQSDRKISCRRVGNGIQGSFEFIVDQGTYASDRVLSDGKKVVDCLRISGNIFGIINDFQSANGISYKPGTAEILGIHHMRAYYDNNTNNTFIGIEVLSNLSLSMNTDYIVSF